MNDAHGVVALSAMDRTRIIEAYLAGSLDLDGDVTRVVAMRELFSDRRPVRYLWRFVRPLLLGRVRRDARAIAMHYDLEEDFRAAGGRGDA